MRLSFVPTVSKTSAVLQSIEQAVKGDAAAVMDSWDTKGDFKEYPHKHADGTLTLRYRSDGVVDLHHFVHLVG